MNQEAFGQIVEKLLESYEDVGGMNNADGLNLPSKRTINALCEDFLQLLFPGFHDEGAIRKEDLPELTHRRASGIAARLGNEICKSLRIDDPRCPMASAEKTTMALFESLLRLRELLGTDIQAAFEGDPAVRSVEEIILSYPFLEAIAIQRVAHELYRAGVPKIPRMMTEWAHARTGIDIHPGAAIESHFFIDHGTGVVIGETCRIGNHVKIYHGVTLGARSFARDEAGQIVKGGKRHPDVGDHVTIYPNSTILGGETVIGENSTIGANVFLMHSVSANSLVVYEEKGLQIKDKGERTPAGRRRLQPAWSI